MDLTRDSFINTLALLINTAKETGFLPHCRLTCMVCQLGRVLVPADKAANNVVVV